MKNLNRRTFIKNTALAGAVTFLGSTRCNRAESIPSNRVILIRDKNLLDDLHRPRAGRAERMLDQAVTTLLNDDDPVSCWKRLVNADDMVGVKSNEWRFLPTPAELEAAIEKRLMNAGVPGKNISIDDRGIRSNPVFQNATALINVRPMRTHHWSGLGTLLKNYIMFVKRPYEYHSDSCADLATIWKRPDVAGKTRLNILVMFTPLFHGIGPHHYNPEYVWAYKGMIVGFDPVAVDSVGMRIMQAKRTVHFGEERPLNPPAKHIELADTRHHLGTADAAKIDLIKLGWKEDILI
ncbi:DUF362 domain-containing protein [candidate division KSB1 bacterium]|nr:DUF362 domain-containing protein [candidate division KSB1 bacterium]